MIIKIRSHCMMGLALAGTALATGASWAATSQSDEALIEVAVVDTVTVTATRVEQPEFDVPASIDVISGDDLYGRNLGVNLSEGLTAVAGMHARDRQNYAQDTQISIRGFGARASFGIRGIRLYVDGIPATQPDGQGQVSHFNLATADRVEVLRGPFSSLYGNASGGVIQLFTADGGEQSSLSLGSAFGSFGAWRTNIGASGQLGESGNADYNIGYSHFETDGFRDHSEAERESFNGKVNLRVGSNGKLSLVANYFDSPETQDPLGLTRQQFEQDPSQADSRADDFRTRKSIEQIQGGAIYEHALSDQSGLRLVGYGGRRQVQQFLAIPTFVQTGSETHSGAVIDLDNEYAGTDMQWNWEGLIDGRPLLLVVGMSYDMLSQERLGFEGFVLDQGVQIVGDRGRLRRNEVNDIDNFDQYIQAALDLSDRWSAMLGLRHSKVEFDSQDKYIVGANGDDSGRTDFSQTTPSFGLMFKASPGLHLYSAFGRGFETPTFAEAAYRPDGGPGLNFELQAARSSNTEVGAKWRLNPSTRINAALFHIRTRDELIVATSSGGRTTFVNGGDTLRQGAELSLDARLIKNVQLLMSWTVIEAELPDGNQLPGVPESSFYGALNWGGETGWHAGIDGQYVDAVAVNDDNSEFAPAYGIMGLNAGYALKQRWGRLSTFLRMENVLDEDHVGSVIVNERNGRYYEPGPDTSVIGGFQIDWNY